MDSLTLRQAERTAEIFPRRNSPRSQIIWTKRLAILGISVVAAALTYGISVLVPGTYAAYSDVQVSSTQAPTSVDAVNGVNGLAAQYVQFARTAVVMNDAASKSGISVARLTADTTASTLDNTNIVRITVKAGSASEARRGALAVSEALVTQTEKTSSLTGRTDQQQLADLDKLLNQSKADAARLTSILAGTPVGSAKAQAINTELDNTQQQVTALTLKRIDLVSQASKDASEGQIKLYGLTTAPEAIKVAPQPLLYAIVALVVSLVLVAELFVVSERRKSRPITRRPGSLAA